MGLIVETIGPEEERKECHICTVARSAAGMDPKGGPRATLSVKSPDYDQPQREEYPSCPYHLERTVTCLMRGEEPGPTTMPQPPLWPMAR